MGQISSRHRPEDPLSSPQAPPSSAHSSSTRIADHSLPSRTPRPLNPRPHSSHHPSDLDNQTSLPDKRSRRRSLLGTLRSPIRNYFNSQRSPNDEGEPKRWRRRKASEPTRILHDHPEQDDSQLSGPSRALVSSAPSPQPSNATAVDQKGKAKEGDSAASATDVPSPASVGSSSSGSSTMDVPQPNFVPPQSTATEASSSPSASQSDPSSSPPRDPLALNHDPAPLPSSTPLELDHTTERNPDNSDAFNVMERPATPPDPSQAPPLPEARRNFPAAGTLVVVQGVVHTSDVSQSASPETNDATPRRASSVPPPGDRAPRRRFSDLLARPIRSRRSSYAAPDSQFSETSASTENDNQDESSPSREISQDSPAQEEPPVPASRPLSLSPTSIDVLGTLLRYTIAHLVY